MFFVLSKLLDVLLAPMTWALLAIAAGGVAFWRGRKRLGAGLLAAAVGILYLFSVEPVSNALARALEGGAVRTFREDFTYDAVVVLGGLVDVDAMEASGTRAYDDNVERLLAGWWLMRTNRARMVVVSGGNHDPSRPVLEAKVLAAELAEWGVPPAQIVVEDWAMNTRENAVAVAEIARARGWKELVLVTSAAHMPRALGCFAAVGLKVDALPVDYRTYDPALRWGTWLPRAGALEDSTAALREWFGRGIYRLKGYSTDEVATTGPRPESLPAPGPGPSEPGTAANAGSAASHAR